LEFDINTKEAYTWIKGVEMALKRALYLRWMEQGDAPKEKRISKKRPEKRRSMKSLSYWL
jgi:hypothetical protein